MASRPTVPQWDTLPRWGSRTKKAQPKPWSAALGPVQYVIDAAAPSKDPRVAQYLANGYLDRPGTNCGTRTRPGFARASVYLGTTPLAPLIGTQIVPTVPQAIVAWPIPGFAPGFGQYIAFVGGHIFVGPAEQVQDPTSYGFDITPTSGVVIDPSTLVIYTCWFANGLVVSDTVNPPWFVSTANLEAAIQNQTPIGGATVIDIGPSGNAVPGVGPPVVYDGCLFFIQPGVAANIEYNVRLVWSQPNQPTLGYMQTVAGFTFTNFFSVAEAGSLSLNALCAENNCIYYFRKSSIGMLTGNVGSDFAVSAVQDTVSETIGCINAASIVKVDADVFFIDQHGKPQRLVTGGSLVPLWIPAANTIYQTSSVQQVTGRQLVYPPGANVTCGAYSPNLNIVAWSVNVNVTPPEDVMLVFCTLTNRYLGVWYTAQSVLIDTGQIGLNTYRAMTTGISNQIVWLNTAGQMYCQFPREYDPGIDYIEVLQSGNLCMTTIPLSLGFSQAGQDDALDKIFDRLDLSLLGNPIYNSTNELILQFGYVTNRGAVFPVGSQILQFTTSGVPSSTNWQTQHLALGLNAFGRIIEVFLMIQPTIITSSGPAVNLLEYQPFTIVSGTVRGWIANDHPAIP